jgi:quercetin 2,3-dioxygenase
MSLRPVKNLMKSKPTMEGAGVHLRRAFGFGDTSEYDPFLLLDDFRSDNPAHYLAGFPWHPHRGIETITYVLAGSVEHGDSMGNKGVIGPGDVQWMTAGSGIIHQEMPKGDPDGRMYGFQLWANLPAFLKMTAPRYQEIKAADMPLIQQDGGVAVKVVCGSFEGIQGPVEGIAADPTYLDVFLPPGTTKALPVPKERNAFAYIFSGDGDFCNSSDPVSFQHVENFTLALFDAGDEIMAQAGKNGMRFLLASGKPLKEPVAWRGPIVMNTQAELMQAFEELDQGTFLK